MILRMPGLDLWWKGMRSALPPDYVDYLESLRAEDGPTMIEAVAWYGPDEREV